MIAGIAHYTGTIPTNGNQDVLIGNIGDGNAISIDILSRVPVIKNIGRDCTKWDIHGGIVIIYPANMYYRIITAWNA